MVSRGHRPPSGSFRCARRVAR